MGGNKSILRLSQILQRSYKKKSVLCFVTLSLAMISYELRSVNAID